MKLIKVNINDLTNEEINDLVEAFEVEINAYLEANKDEIVFLGEVMDFHIPNATDDEICGAINDIVCYNLRKELMKIFDALLVEENEIIDSMVMDFVEELFMGK